VPAFGTWGGSIGFHSPQGSGVFDKFDSREDMTIEIIMVKTPNTNVSGTITARTMFQFGVNITRVAFEDFVGQENADLDAAAAVTRTIYERRDLTFTTDDRGIEQARVGGSSRIPPSLKRAISGSNGPGRTPRIISMRSSLTSC